MTSTLHDFVLNLITDSQARSVFELDPEAALTAAGLGDITPADVTDVVPLVMDYAAVPGLAGLSLPTAAVETAAGDTVSATAIAQLQSVTAQLSAGTANPGDLGTNAAAAGLAIDHNSVQLGVGALTGLGLGAISEASVELPVDLGPGGDITAQLDADVTGAVYAPVNEVAGTVYDVADTAGLGDTVTGVGSTVGGLDGTISGLGGTVFGTVGLGLNTVGGTLHGVTGTVNGLTGTVSGVTGTVNGLTTGVSGITDHVTHGTGLDHTLDGVTSSVDGITGDTLGTVTGGAGLTDLTGGTGLGDVTGTVTGTVSDVTGQHGSDLSGVTDILF
ncbi:IniB N-terminal domain-containing protein [Catenuloplanes japonicus]|uniref:IniB N-terminal domain-containing protein n=1 Tax=Catenuloplanes japonicus TaxID=33876 RepID=UPI00068B7736|nr:IniB N-terminal domain-containing protein [Catenuloplanes japonicus]